MRSSIGIGAWIALATIEAVFYGLVGAASPVLHRLRAWPFWLAGAWTTMEVVRSGWPFSGMPWGRLGFGVVDTPLAPALAYVGINGVSFVVAAIGFLLARLVLALEPGGDDRLLASGESWLVAAVRGAGRRCQHARHERRDHRRRRPGRRARSRATTSSPTPRRVTQNHVDATVDLADDVAAGAQPRPDFVRLAGELHRHRPVPTTCRPTRRSAAP